MGYRTYDRNGRMPRGSTLLDLGLFTELRLINPRLSMSLLERYHPLSNKESLESE